LGALRVAGEEEVRLGTEGEGAVYEGGPREERERGLVRRWLEYAEGNWIRWNGIVMHRNRDDETYTVQTTQQWPCNKRVSI
jgi:hypothetical protein